MTVVPIPFRSPVASAELSVVASRFVVGSLSSAVSFVGALTSSSVATFVRDVTLSSAVSTGGDVTFSSVLFSVGVFSSSSAFSTVRAITLA